jgi:hypothetical protein
MLSASLNVIFCVDVWSPLLKHLQCHSDPMRITKKYAGASCIGKVVFQPSTDSPPVADNQENEELARLEKVFLAKLYGKSTKGTGGNYARHHTRGSGSRNDGDDDYSNYDDGLSEGDGDESYDDAGDMDIGPGETDGEFGESRSSFASSSGARGGGGEGGTTVSSGVGSGGTGGGALRRRGSRDRGIDSLHRSLNVSFEDTGDFGSSSPRNYLSRFESSTSSKSNMKRIQSAPSLSSMASSSSSSSSFAPGGASSSTRSGRTITKNSLYSGELYEDPGESTALSFAESRKRSHSVMDFSEFEHYMVNDRAAGQSPCCC